jgi:LPS-assembly protein
VRRTLRLLPLPFCIGLSLAAHGAESRPDDWRLCPTQDAVPAFSDAQQATGRDQRLQQPTDIEGDQVIGTETRPQFEGNVALRRGDQFLGTKKLTYDSDTGKYVAEGDVRYQDEGMRMVAERAEGNQNTDTHDVQSVQYQLMARRGNGGAEHIQMHGAQGSLYGSTYSTCPPDQRMWELRAKRIDVNTDTGQGVARNATLRVGRVPVLYVPWFPFPIDNRRRTGLLSPSIGSSNRNGFDYRQPYYLNLAPNYDMTLTPRLMTSRGLQLGTEFRYLTETGRGVFDFAYLPNDRLTDRDRAAEQAELTANHYPLDNRRADNRGSFRFVGSQDISDTWHAAAKLGWISDTRYLSDFNNNLEGLTPYSLTSTIGLYGQGQYWTAALTADHKQLADYTLRESVLPYNRVPRAYFHWEQPFGKNFVAGADTEAVRFQDPVKPGGSRVDIKPYVSMPLEGASWFVTPTLAWRYTGYQLEDARAQSIANGRAKAAFPAGTVLTPEMIAPFYDSTPNRSLPIASLDAGLYFDRDTSWGGESFLQTLEPRLFYLRVPYRNQSNLPLFDTRDLTFSWGQLFRDNRFTGADRQTNANQVTLAMTSRLIRQSDGKEKLTASLGEILYFDSPRVGVTQPPAERSRSAWVADANWAVSDRWTIGGSYQWDPDLHRKNLSTIRTQYLIGDEGVANFSYRYRRGLLEQVDLSFLYPLTPSWSLIGRYYYSLFRRPSANPLLNQEPKLLEGIAGIQWDSCCMAVRLVGRRYIHNREGELNNAIQVEVEFKGLGSAGPDTESRLRRAILGYYREDLYLVPPSDLDGSGDDTDSPELTP